MNNLELDNFIRAALIEDIGSGDVTTEACVPAESTSHGYFIAKESGVICGIEAARRVFALLDGAVVLTPRVKDGDAVNKGDVIAEIRGPSRSILTGERVALNIMQRLSGTATATARAAAQVKGTHTKIVDTRKATPLLRTLEKYAVRVGGGHNHRYNLADGVLIKDNHIEAAGGIAEAVKAARCYVPHTMKIEVETETLEQVQQALDAGADVIMLDNMDNDTMSAAVKLIDGRALTEASGNMGDRDLSEVAKTGVDMISMGALTHSVKALDISLKFKLPKA